MIEMIEDPSSADWHPDEEGRYWCKQGIAYLDGIKKTYSLERATSCFYKAVEHRDVAAAYYLRSLNDWDLIKINDEDLEVFDRILANHNSVKILEKQIIHQVFIEKEDPVGMIIKCSNKIETTLATLYPDVKSKSKYKDKSKDGQTTGTLEELINTAFKRKVINETEKEILHQIRIRANRTRHDDESKWATLDDKPLVEQAYEVIAYIRNTYL